jgi:hypothetical protein
VREVREREQALTEARAALEQERRRAGAGAEQARAEAERLRGELAASRADLAREREAAARAAGELAAARAPQTNVPILFLNPERGGGSAAEPTLRLRLPPAPGRVVLALEIDPPHHPSYRAVLRDARGRELWRGADLRLNEMEALTVSLPASLLAPGDYVLAVEGVPPAGAPGPPVRFSFRVLPPA